MTNKKIIKSKKSSLENERGVESYNSVKMVKEGYIIDYISGQEIKETPEEVDAVQVFSKQLVEDYGYEKVQIQTRPQFRVKIRPSDRKKEYPVDIAIFSNKTKNEDDVFIIVECKKKTRKDGRDQLEDYLRFSKAGLGVWFNGKERLFLRKIEKDGKILFEEIPNIPKYGQRLEDIGLFKRKDLKATHNLKATFKAIRNHLAGNAVGTTRDEEFAKQLINVIFCKIYDEKFTKPNEMVSFRAGIDEDPEEIKERILNLFDKVKKNYQEVISFNEEIELDKNSIYYIVGELQNYSLLEAERDVIADAFETFIGHALKGEQGQFFTPRNVIQMMVEILDPDDEDKIIDPACGSGGFLIDSLRYVWNKIEKKGEEYGWSELEVDKEKQKVAINNFRGIDKDSFLSKVTKAYMAIIGDGKGGVFCADSLDPPKSWDSLIRNKIQMDSFNVLLTNPPFGSKIPVKGTDKLKQFDLGYKWKYDKKNKRWDKTSEINDKGKKGGIEPQILFIERSLEFLKDGGRMAIVLPDGVYGNNQLGFIRKVILNKARLLAIIDVPTETFSPNTTTKTSVMILQKLSKDKIPSDYPIFMAVAESCGHDRRGNEIEEDDIKKVSKAFHKWLKENKIKIK